MRNQGRDIAEKIRRDAPLGAATLWKQVGFAGAPFEPVEGTYRGVDPVRVRFAPVEDSGPAGADGSRTALLPLICATLYEVAFACEAGPLTTWSN